MGTRFEMTETTKLYVQRIRYINEHGLTFAQQLSYPVLPDPSLIRRMSKPDRVEAKIALELVRLLRDVDPESVEDILSTEPDYFKNAGKLGRKLLFVRVPKTI